MVFTKDFMCMFIELYLQPTLKHRLLVFRMICSTLCLHRLEKWIPINIIRFNKSKCKDNSQYQYRVGE